MIEIEQMTLKSKNTDNQVVFTYCGSDKPADCSCGNSWVPKNINDVCCSKCDPGESRELFKVGLYG